MTYSRFAPAIHVRFDGRTQRLNSARLGLAANAGDAAIKHALAHALDVAPAQFALHQIERHDNGDITVCPAPNSD